MEKTAHSSVAAPYPPKPIRVIHIEGSDYEIGRRHAEHLGEDADAGMLKFYLDFWKRMSGNVRGRGWARHLVGAAKYLVDPVLVRRLGRNIPQFGKERLRGLAHARGKSYDETLTLLVLPDLLPLLQTYLTLLQPDSFVGVVRPSFGCSSFISSGGRYFLHGRNLDFPGVAYWDRYPVIQMTRRKNALGFIGFTTAGVPLCGITGVNEAQVSVSLHQHYCRVADMRGALPFVLGEEILSRARSISEAVDILDRSRVATSWAFVLTDGKTRDAVIYECHPKARGIRRLGEERRVMSHSNHFQSAACQPAEYSSNARMTWDNFARSGRLRELVSAEGAGLTPARAARIISDHYDPFWAEEKPYNRTVSQVYNIQSLVLDPENMRVWIAEGAAPIHLRAYAEYDLGAIFDGKEGRTGTTVDGYRFRNPSIAAAKEAYVNSFVAAMDGDLGSAWTDLEKSLALHFVPEGALTAAVLNLKERRFDVAAPLLERAVANIESQLGERAERPPEYYECLLFLARAYDLLGRRREAISCYRRVSGDPGLRDSNIRKLALKEGPYREAMLDRILMPYSTYIPFQ